MVFDDQINAQGEMSRFTGQNKVIRNILLSFLSQKKEEEMD